MLEALATSRVRMAGPQTGRKGYQRTEEGEKSVIVGYIRRMVSITTFKAQCHSLLGRLEAIGAGAPAAMGRRKEALELDMRWRRSRKAHCLSERQGWNIVRKGFAKLD